MKMKLVFSAFFLMTTAALVETAEAACSINTPGDCLGAGGSVSNEIKPEYREAWSIVSPRFYSDTYGDLREAFGTDESALFRHWAQFGRYEARRPSPGFDPIFYLNNNSDLLAAFGNDPARASYHWYEWGQRECRQGAPEFNPKNYLNRYPDLKAAFGNDCTAAYQHYIKAGYYEGRNAR